jgi:serine/threonine-protein kinase
MAETAEPKRIGRYDIVSVLGEGAMGVVYEGQDSRLHRKVAIKTILKSALDSDSAKEYSSRFRREAQAVARLNHPNIVQVFDYAEEGEVAYIVMEFVKGRELKHFFQAKERFELKEVVHIMGELCDALHFAHAAGIIHRDIKPANVMIDSQGRVKLTDFGVARITDLERTVSERTQAGTILGTPAYMSPEQVQGQPLDRRTDIFSAGVILYEFLTGERPFPGPGAWTIAKNILQLTPPPPSASNTKVSPLFDAVVAKALAKNADDRYQDASDLGLALKRALDGLAEAEEAERTVILNPPPGLAAAPAPAAADGKDDDTVLRTLPNAAAPPIAAPPRSKEFELEFWRSIKDRNDADDFDLYVQQFPSGIYAALARRRSAKLRGLAVEDSAAKAVSQEQEKREIEEAARREAEARARLAEEKAELEARLARREAELQTREAERQAVLEKREAELIERELKVPRRSPVVPVLVGLAVAVAGYGVWTLLKPPDPLAERVAELTRLLDEAKKREVELVATRAREAELLKELEVARASAAEAMKSGDVAKQRELAEQVKQREAEAAKQAALVKQREAEAKKQAEAAERRRIELARLQEESTRRRAAPAPTPTLPSTAPAPAPAPVEDVAKAAEPAKPAAVAVAPRPAPAPASVPAAPEPAKKAAEPVTLAAVTPTPDPAPTPETLLARAIALDNDGKSAEAARMLRQLSRAKSKTGGEAAKRLGDMLQVGRPGVSRDYGEALRYYQVARDNGIDLPVTKGRN